MNLAAFTDPPKIWTYSDYVRLNDEHRYEIIQGDLSMAPAPTFNHQAISMNLAVLLQRFVTSNDLGLMLAAPIDVILDELNVIQPDLLFVFRAHRGIIRSTGIFGAPDLTIEILSPTSQYRDLYQKKAIYERAGVAEYWIINPAMKSVDILTLEDGVYRLYQEAALGVPGVESPGIDSLVLPGLHLDLQAIFSGLMD